eukprot:TRINITY_DN15826_c0_g1_i1.p1 TRINITY_DN15826_c0_g1~~TRINITY_DN15826_c0_g1_i1.p1  ORF type:complete len:50 (-),score=0.90 TRINITY_DN15826_c0_g1_i1:105-254(-)
MRCANICGMIRKSITEFHTDKYNPCIFGNNICLSTICCTFHETINNTNS